MSRSCFTLLSVGLSLFSASCGHTQGASGAAPQGTQLSRQPVDVARVDGSASREELDKLMKEHFATAVWARDAVIDGNLEPIRQPLRILSDYGYETVPLAWMGGIARLQAAARLTSNAESLEAAASGIASLANICGRCHLDQSHVVPLDKHDFVDEGSASEGIRQRMSRHAWAAERLWDGLVAPSDDAWRTGAAALAQTPKPDEPATLDFARDFDELRKLGVRAHSETTSAIRAEIYGRVLTTCSRCHARVDEHGQSRVHSGGAFCVPVRLALLARRAQWLGRRPSAQS